MNLEAITRRMERFPPALHALLAGLPAEDARQRGAAGQWSFLEIVCHLADEEEADFGPRLRLTLEDPGREWPPINPEGWARERRYNERDLGAELARFTASRAANIAWLRSLREPDWDSVHKHPLGNLTAGDLLASWCAHDALHLRQIAKRLYELAQRDAPGRHVDYAGPWEPPPPAPPPPPRSAPPPAPAQ